MLRRFALMVSVVACAGSASAQDSRIEIGVNLGWTLSDGVSFQPLLAGDGNIYDSIGPTDGFSWGLNLGYHATPNVEVGLLFDRQSSTLDVAGTNTRSIGDMNVDNYHGYATYSFGDEDATVRPYVMAGLGFTNYGSVGYTVGDFTGETEGNAQFSTTWGAGLKFNPSPRWVSGSARAGRRRTSSPMRRAGGAIPTGAATSRATPSTRTRSSSAAA